MRTKTAFFLVLFYCMGTKAFTQSASFISKVDSLLKAPTKKPFNGVLLVTQKGQTIYAAAQGMANREEQIPIQLNHQFVVGSISKQFTAVLVLQEWEQGRLSLTEPIRTYLPQLEQSWADTVTVHHLLTHTHGIVKKNQPLAFRPGTQFGYSQLGYELLSKIVESTSKKTFAELSDALFKKCGMKNSYHPDTKGYQQLVSGYAEALDGTVNFEKSSFENYVAAGTFISTAEDLAKWNRQLHRRNILSDSAYQLMMTKHALRQHPMFGPLEYGYGITLSKQGALIQLGQTGFTPGFVSMAYYYPEKDMSVIALSNLSWDDHDLNKAFYYHLQILRLIQDNLDNKPESKTNKKGVKSSKQNKAH